jgi:hypothetical protein
VIGEETQSLDFEPLQQQPRAPGVLAGDHIGLVKSAAGAQCDVLEIPDRGRADHELAGHQMAAIQACTVAVLPI